MFCFKYLLPFRYILVTKSSNLKYNMYNSRTFNVTLKLEVIQQEAITTDKLTWHTQKQISGKRFNQSRLCKYQVQTGNNKCFTLLRTLTLKQCEECKANKFMSVEQVESWALHCMDVLFRESFFFKSQSCWKNLGHKIGSLESCLKNSSHRLLFISFLQLKAANTDTKLKL